MSVQRIIHGDCLEILPSLPHAKLIFADPPDNRELNYEGFYDFRSDYIGWLANVLMAAMDKCDIFWLSYAVEHDIMFSPYLTRMVGMIPRKFIWFFSFGQHRQTDCGNNYRLLLRIMKVGTVIYPDAIRVPSARIKTYGDIRADPRGRVPGDVFEFSRVCGTFRERRKWIPTQHPEALMERIIKLSCSPSDTVIDLFAGSGTTLRVCRKLNMDAIGIEISETYCEDRKSVV